MEAVWKGNENGVVLYVWLNCLLACKRPRCCSTGLRFGRNENVKVEGFEPPQCHMAHSHLHTLTHYTLYSVRMCSDWMVCMTEPLRQTADAFWVVKQRGIILCGIKEKLPELEIEHSDQCLAGNSYKTQKILGLVLPSVKQTERTNGAAEILNCTIQMQRQHPSHQAWEQAKWLEDEGSVQRRGLWLVHG